MTLPKDVYQPKSTLALRQHQSSTHIRRSLATVGFTISLTTAGLLLSNQVGHEQAVTPVVPSSRTLTQALSQNQDHKYEQARAAIAAGDWEAPRGVVVHEVKENETLWKLTQVYQVDAAVIATSNGINARTDIQPGIKLYIPPVSGLVHRVRPGDTLESISAYYNVSRGEIARFSALDSDEFLAVDSPVVIPGNVTQLLQVKETHAKRKLVAERDRLARRLGELEGKPVLVSHQLQPQTQRYITHTVRNGDTISMLARRYGVSQQRIIATNGLNNAHWLDLDQDLKIPVAEPEALLAFVNKPPKSVQVPIAASTVPTVGGAPIRVAAATPMVLPTAVTPLDGLWQLSGASPTVPSEPAQEQLVATASIPTSGDGLPVASEPLLKVAANILPAPVTAMLPSVVRPEEPAATLPPAAPLETVVPPASEPQFSAAAPLPERVAALTTEQLPTVSPVPVRELPSQPAALERPVPTVIPERVAAARPTEQVTLPIQVPAATTSQPADESNVKLPQRIAAAAIPQLPITATVEQTEVAQPRPQEARLPLDLDTESRMASVEVQRLEQEVEQLATKVREAEVRQAQRIASARLNPIPRTGTSVTRTGSRLAPELPSLSATAYLPDANSYGLSTGFIWPADGVFTSGFGWRWGRVHQGIDIAAPVGTPIWAAASGEVVFAGWNDGGYGNMVDIRHSDGTVTRYAHLHAVHVSEGQQVSQGQVIAAMGSTGFSTGPHLHFEIRPGGGSAVNPMNFLARR
ncbi:MAG: peptidoglycan DD-metalloendopeptidase family protein [Oscillatoriales cyanobacterium SM2_2_1]|nr:peptidoglycan DD-metalloendopeptidase family protein [Oscillatoriales cyanobacterium SM2_2_1]